jgi:hypothetical protein
VDLRRQLVHIIGNDAFGMTTIQILVGKMDISGLWYPLPKSPQTVPIIYVDSSVQPMTRSPHYFRISLPVDLPITA